jgi:hypothetical protein
MLVGMFYTIYGFFTFSRKTPTKLEKEHESSLIKEYKLRETSKNIPKQSLKE